VILVTVGSSSYPFDRLLSAVAALPRGDDELVVQHGPSLVRPAAARCIDFLPFEELSALVREARLVVTHGGVGSILLALSGGKKPLVVPRRRAFGETVDDHQLESARRFAAAGLVTLVEDPADLPAAVAAPHETLSMEQGEPRLVAELRSYVTEVVG